jgi:hypothetical protein
VVFIVVKKKKRNLVHHPILLPVPRAKGILKKRGGLGKKEEWTEERMDSAHKQLRKHFTQIKKVQRRASLTLKYVGTRNSARGFN